MSWQPSGFQPTGWQPEGWQPGDGVSLFAGTIADILLAKNSGSHTYDLSVYFEGATSYAISPAVEAGWSFNVLTGVLTIDTDEADTFGPYVITASNSNGSDDSNAFSVSVAVVKILRVIKSMRAPRILFRMS
jgi:hypothetical protein